MSKTRFAVRFMTKGGRSPRVRHLWAQDKEAAIAKVREREAKGGRELDSIIEVAECAPGETRSRYGQRILDSKTPPKVLGDGEMRELGNGQVREL